MKLSLIWMIPLMALVSLSGCVSLLGAKKKNLHYNYEKPKFETDFGAFYVTLTSEPKLDLARDEEVVIWTEPYMFNTQYLTKERSVRFGRIENVKVRSVATGDDVLSAVVIENEIIKQREDDYASLLKKFLAFGKEIPQLSYEDYRVTFDYSIYVNEDTVFDKGTVDILVKTKYYEKIE